MDKHWKYFKYVLRHKYYVAWAGLRLGVPLWQLIVHDLSKLRPREWFPYVDFFYGGALTEQVEDAFNMAWNYHQKANPHHWQFWILREDDGVNLVYIEMPDKYVREMIADWVGAGMALGKRNLKGWYAENQYKQLMHPCTRTLVSYYVNRWEY